MHGKEEWEEGERDAELREFGDTGDKAELQIWVELFQRAVEILHIDTAKNVADKVIEMLQKFETEIMNIVELKSYHI